MELFEQIRREYEHGGGTIRGIAKKLGIHRRMVREAVLSAVPVERKTPIRERPKLEPAMAFIDAVLEADKQAPRKQAVAGAVHRVAPQAQPMARAGVEMMMAKPGFAQEAFGEYHLYTLEHRTSIGDKETKQISLLNATNVPLEKIYRVNSQGNYTNAAGPGEPEKPPVTVYYRFRNDQKSSLGMPLPGGVIRVYQADSAGRLQFSGEDNIQHTPKDEDVTINTGNAFDIVCERKQKDFQMVADRVSEAEWQITLRNHKDTAVTVEVRETIYGSWQVLNSNFTPTKLDANTLSFNVPVEKDGTATLSYRVRNKW